MEKIRILIGADDRYAMPMTVAAHSALYHLAQDREVELHVLDGGISSENRRRSKEILRQAHPLVEIHWRNAQLDDFQDINVGIFSKSSMIRLQVTQLFSIDVERVLYIDSDVVINDDVSQLWQFPLEKFPVWAVNDGPPGSFKVNITDKFPEVKAHDDALYFNSGVLLFNLPEWRTQRISEKTLYFLNQHSHKLSFPDQDALNAVVAGNWGHLPRRWNMQVYRINQPFGPDAKEKGIIHYTTFKPWEREFTLRHKITFFRAFLRCRWSPLPKAVLWASSVYLEQCAKHNILRIKRRLKLGSGSTISR